jgi:hypothetical protein
MSSKSFYYGEEKCTVRECQNKAYWKDKTSNRIACGVHTRNCPRTPLTKRPIFERKKIQEDKLKKQETEIQICADLNKEKELKGHLVVSKLRIMKNPEDLKGYRKVFPNFKHKNRKDGWGLPDLSPMSLGPVYHNQPNLPPALNIENLHQANKVFPSNVEEDQNRPLLSWYISRLQLYEDPVPRRHRPEAKSTKGSPLYSVWVTPKGKELRLSYLESRQIYCTYYQRLAKKTEGFHKLKNALKEGTNLQIIGYDGFDLELTQEDQQDPEHMSRIFNKYYLDPKRPFGHEVVLAVLLLLPSEKYPWKRHRTIEL